MLISVLDVGDLKTELRYFDTGFQVNDDEHLKVNYKSSINVCQSLRLDVLNLSGLDCRDLNSTNSGILKFCCNYLNE